MTDVSNIVRTDLVKSGGNWVSQSVDNLAFNYPNTKSNRISGIADATNNPNGYKAPFGGLGASFSYDANGNATFDPSRGLNLTNNFLNLPSKFTKADGSRQEIIYDASGHKWQEKTYGVNNGILLGQKTYLENTEFEGDELSLIYHPTGFIKKLNTANHLSGTLNGDAQGKSISSTQKIGDGRYTASEKITLLPGFEASAKDAFLAKIGSVNTYQWQYTLRDHLGNQRALFTDKDNDGSIRQSTDENLNEVLALRNYSAFGLEIGGSQQNINYQNAYKYTGKEENSFTGYYDFGARWADPTVGNRFLSVDPKASKMPGVSPYAFCFNNPLIYVDPDGQYPIYILTRSYAPFKTFGPGNAWYGDNRGHTLDRGASYRTLASINYDTETRQTQAFGGRSRSHTVDGTKDAYSNTYIDNRTKGNNIDVHSYGNNAAQTGSWDIDQFTKLTVTTEGNIKKDHVLNISGKVSGDDFPNQESMIYDSKGNGLWLGNYETSGYRQSGPVTDLPLENEGDFQMNIGIRIKVNKDGVFQGVMQKGKDGKESMISIGDWNKKFKSDDNK